MMDVTGALKRLGDDVELLDQIINIFLEDAPGLIHSAREALARGNTMELRRAAHSLKGMMGTLGAQEGVAAALKLEHAATANDLDSAPALIHDCGERIATLTRILNSYVASHEGNDHDGAQTRLSAGS